MKNFKIKLPKELHSIYGLKQKVTFEMSKNHYKLNNVHYDNPLSAEVSKSDFKGYVAHIQNKCVLVTLFYTNDILKGI